MDTDIKGCLSTKIITNGRFGLQESSIITIQLRLFVCCSMGGELSLGCPATLTPLPRDTAVGGRGSRGHGGHGAHQVSQHIPVSQSLFVCEADL